MFELDMISVVIGYAIGVFFCYTTYCMIFAMEDNDDNG